MRQKFRIFQNNVTNELKIREYAIIDKIPKNTNILSSQMENYSLLGEETYRSEIGLTISPRNPIIISEGKKIRINILSKTQIERFRF